MDAPEVPGPKIKAGKTAIPVITAIGIPALAFVGYRWYKSRHGGTSIVSGQPTAASSALDGSVGGVSAGTDPSGLMTVGSGGIGPGSVSGVGTQPFGSGLTLDAWGQAAENYLIGTGTSPLDAVSAVNAYEGGQSLAPEAMALINEALANLGAPPFAPTGVALTGDTSTETTPIAPTSVPTTKPTVKPPVLQTNGITAGGTTIPTSAFATGTVTSAGAPIYDFTAAAVPGAIQESPTSEWVPGWGGVPDPSGSGVLGGYLPAGSLISGSPSLSGHY